MSRELASTRGVDSLLMIAVRHAVEAVGGQLAMLLPDGDGRLTLRAAQPAVAVTDTSEMAVAQWVYEHREMAGLGTTTLPGAKALYLPLVGSRGAVGVMGVRPPDSRTFEAPEQLHLLETFASQTALAIERAILAEEAQAAQVRVEAERLRSSLLSSVSHDLRTPLTSITGAASTLLESDGGLTAASRRDLLETISEEAHRLNRLVQNLLEMTRLEAGVQVKKDWHPLEEVVGAALSHLERLLREHPVRASLPKDLPLVPLDDVLIEQVLINLLENAVKYTPPGTLIEIGASAGDGAVTVEVADRGPGLPPGDVERAFEKFYRGAPEVARGAGLGLAICRAIVGAHGGRIWAENRREGGVAFRFTLPISGTPPQMDGLDG
jgi:two-component system sensor histidine kinase KdpD